MGQHHQEESEGRQAEEEGGGGAHGHLTQHPRQHHRNVLADEADRCQRKLL